MKLYTSIGPNPRLVRMFLAEKGVDIPQVEVDILAGENRRRPYLDLNPAGSTPLLVLETGEALAETTAICEYVEDLQPDPPLIGATPEARASTRMWTRRIDLFVVQPMTNGFRAAEGLGLFKDRVRCLPQAADDLKACARDGLAWLDAQMADGRPHVGGDAMTLADLMLFCFVEFGALVGQAPDPQLAHVAAWHRRMGERPSARASA